MCLLGGARKNEAFLTKNKNPTVFSWAVAHEDTLRVMRLQISQDLGGFLVWVCGEGSGMVGLDEPGGAFWGQNPLICFICPPKIKEPFEEKSLRDCRKHLCVVFSFRPATSSAAPVMPPAFPPRFPGWCQNQGCGWDLGVPKRWEAALVAAGVETRSCYPSSAPDVLMAFWLDVQSTSESRERKRLWHIYTVCWRLVLKKNTYTPRYLRLVLEVWSPHVIEKPSGIHSWTSSPL